MTEDTEIIIRITGCEPVNYHPSEELDSNIATAYCFDAVAGAMGDAMAVLRAYPPRYRWLEDIYSSGSGRFIVFALPPEFRLSVGMEFALSAGPRTTHTQR